MNNDLRNYSTFKIGGTAHKVFEINEKSDIEKINSYSRTVEKPLIVIGEGSNSIFAETTDHYVIGLMRLKGISLFSKTHITAHGGESWDDLVLWSVANNLSGIEALSGIPGTVGAAPVQNIGAYGTELADVFVEAEVFDREKNTFTVFSKEDCQFAYRDSIFKQNPNRFIICNITLELYNDLPTIPQYKAVQEYFSTSNPSLLEIRNAILEIRNRKIPNYKLFPNCGSFFKNPIIDKEHLHSVLIDYPDIPHFKTNDNQIKLYAGWIIEHVDYKSAQNDKVIFNEANKLILINTGDARFKNLKEVIENITKLVKESFDIVLETEPNIFR